MVTKEEISSIMRNDVSGIKSAVRTLERVDNGTSGRSLTGIVNKLASLKLKEFGIEVSDESIIKLATQWGYSTEYYDGPGNPSWANTDGLYNVRIIHLINRN